MGFRGFTAIIILNVRFFVEATVQIPFDFGVQLLLGRVFIIRRLSSQWGCISIYTRDLATDETAEYRWSSS